MIRFAAIQFRVQAAIALAGLVALAVLLAVTGPHLLHVYDTTVATCQAHGDCPSESTLFLQTFRGIQIGLDALVVVVPGLLGIFWGAPLVARELETGTYKLAWTQSVTRTKWLGTKLALVGLSAALVAGLTSLMATWWSSPVDRVNMNVFTTFDQRGLVPVGFALFAFALGVAIGVSLRRTIPAMATVLVSFVAIRLLANHFVLPRLLAPTVRQYPLGLGSTVQGFGSMNGGPAMLIAGAPNLPSAWIYSADIVNKTGRTLTPQLLARQCPSISAALAPPQALSGGAGSIGVRPAPAAISNALQECIAKVGVSFRDVVTYQPASHYWPLQWYELGIYVGAACVLGALSLWWIRRRPA
jgi:hypothetical protein